MNEFITRTGPGTPMGEYMRRFWVPIMPADRVAERDGVPVRVTIMSEDLLCFRETSGRVSLVDAYCPHRLAPLFFGRNEENGIRCIYHGWKFDGTGTCLDIPADPSGRYKDHVRVKAYPTREAGGLIWGYMGPKDLQPEMPDLEFIRLPEDHRIMVTRLVESNYLQALEGDHDSSHANFLHARLRRNTSTVPNRTQKFLDINYGVIPTPEVTRRDAGVVSAFKRVAGNYALWRHSFWLTPFYSVIAQEPGQAINIGLRVPRDDHTSWQYQIQFQPDRPIDDSVREMFLKSDRQYSPADPSDPEGYRPLANKSNDYLIDRFVQRHETFSGIGSIHDQDRAVSEGMPIIDRTKEHLMLQDAAIIAIRRFLIDGAQALAEGEEPVEATDGSLYTGRSLSVLLPNDVPYEEGIKSCPSVELWESQERPADLPYM